MTKPLIHVVVERPDGRRSDATVVGNSITAPMLDAAEDLLSTITSGERSLPKDLYDACATAFDTTRDDAKKRLLAALYGKREHAHEPTLIGWTWRAHLNELHAHVRAGQWFAAVRKLTLMLNYAVANTHDQQEEQQRRKDLGL